MTGLNVLEGKIKRQVNEGQNANIGENFFQELSEYLRLKEIASITKIIADLRQCAATNDWHPFNTQMQAINPEFGYTPLVRF